MCGICGVLGLEDKELIQNMAKIMYHRGPDAFGQHIDKNIMLGHARLSIIDLSEKGNQPLYNEDQSITLVANGEIYNFKDVRVALEKRGHRFASSADVEVILHAYEEYGTGCVKLFNGCFAFAIWDSNKKQLILARDRHGIKPLFYTQADGKFFFASEIKSILTHPEIKRKIDPQAINYFINLRYFPKDSTPFLGIKKLLPAHIMVINTSGAQSYQEYWEPNLEIKDAPLQSIVAELKQKLKNAVEQRMMADVPIAICLSGGLDSSTVVALASELSKTPLKTFTMGFGEEQDEIEDAAVIADHFETDHETLIIKSNLLRDYPKMIWHADHPKRNLYPYYLSKAISKKVKVVLGGMGSDELFGGYTWKYVTANVISNTRRRLERANLTEQVTQSARTILEYQTSRGLIEDDRFLEYVKRLSHINDNTDLYLTFKTLDEVYGDRYLERIYSEDFIDKIKEPYNSIRKIYSAYFNNPRHLIDQILLADYSIKMKDDFLFVEDAMTMANSLESRAPFLDNQLVDFAFTIPFKYKIYNVEDAHRGRHTGKFILREAMRDKLPKQVFTKPKQGWGSDVFQTYTKELREFASQLLPGSDIVKDRIIKQDYVTSVLSHYASRNLIKHYCSIWNLVCLELWYKMYIKNGDVSKPKLNINTYL